MRLYQCEDGSWAGTQADAKLRGKAFDQVEVPTDKPGLIAFLNQQLNAVEDLRPAPVPDSATPTFSPSADLAEASLRRVVDDGWDKFPLAFQLHLAAKAMENARAAVAP